MKRLWTLLNSNFFLLILGFILTTIVGTFLANHIQKQSWKEQMEMEEKRQHAEWVRDKKFEILRRKLDSGQQALEEISNLMNLRFFRLQNVYLNIVQNDISSANKNWVKYLDTVEEWNVKLIINQNKIRRLVNEEEARIFNNYETDNPHLKDPKTIHGKFFLAHQEVLNLLRCLRNPGCSITQEQKSNLSKVLRDLDYQTDNFIDRASDTFIYQTVQLETLE